MSCLVDIFGRPGFFSLKGNRGLVDLGVERKRGGGLGIVERRETDWDVMYIRTKIKIKKKMKTSLASASQHLPSAIRRKIPALKDHPISWSEASCSSYPRQALQETLAGGMQPSVLGQEHACFWVAEAMVGSLQMYSSLSLTSFNNVTLKSGCTPLKGPGAVVETRAVCGFGKVLFLDLRVDHTGTWLLGKCTKLHSW